eukprot:3496608-Alexandrium_andersonii.AAC.1
MHGGQCMCIARTRRSLWRPELRRQRPVGGREGGWGGVGGRGRGASAVTGGSAAGSLAQQRMRSG